MIMTVPTSGLLRPASVDVSDLTTAARDGDPSWIDSATLLIPFDPEPSPAEQKAIRLRLLTRDAVHEARIVAMAAAVDDLTTLEDVIAAVQLLLANTLVEVEGNPAPALESWR